MSTQPRTLESDPQALRSSSYQQLGGMSGVSAAVKRFYKEMSHDPVLHPYFRETDLTWLAARQTQFVAQTLGAAITYKGPSMKDVHALSLAHARRGVRPSVVRTIVALVEAV